MGVLDRFRRKQVARSQHAPVVHTEVLRDEVRWSQPFHWGLLMAYDNDADWELPTNLGEGHVAGNTSCLAVPVLHSQDVEFDDPSDTGTPLPEAEVEVVVTKRPLEIAPVYDGPLQCPSGRLQVGDADEYRLVQVPPGDLRIQVWLEPVEHARRVVIALQDGG